MSFFSAPNAWDAPAKEEQPYRNDPDEPYQRGSGYSPRFRELLESTDDTDTTPTDEDDTATIETAPKLASGTSLAAVYTSTTQTSVLHVTSSNIATTTAVSSLIASVTTENVVGSTDLTSTSAHQTTRSSIASSQSTTASTSLTSQEAALGLSSATSSYGIATSTSSTADTAGKASVSSVTSRGAGDSTSVSNVLTMGTSSSSSAHHASTTKTSSLVASTSTAASTTGGTTNMPFRCSPYVIFTQKDTYMVPLGVQAYPRNGATIIHVDELDLSAGRILKSTNFMVNPNQQTGGLSCDYYTMQVFWQLVRNFASGITAPLFPIFDAQTSTPSTTDRDLQGAVFCFPSYNTHLLQAVYVTRSARYNSFDLWNGFATSFLPMVRMPIRSPNLLEITTYRIHILAQLYTSLICPADNLVGLALTSSSSVSSNATSDDLSIWDGIMITCSVNSGSDFTTIRSYLSPAENSVLLSTTGPITTHTGGGTSEPLVFASLNINYDDPGETVSQRELLKLGASSLLCSNQGRMTHFCSDCILG